MPTSQTTIQLKFPNVRPKLQDLFPFDPKYDIEIIHNLNKYQLRLPFLRLQSDYFKNYIPNPSKVLPIKEDFDKDQFQAIMKCFYGGTYNCPRNQLFRIWRIVDFLKIGLFKKIILKDFKKNIHLYDFFELLSFGFEVGVEQVFNFCLVQLDQQNFTQLKKHKQSLLDCSLQAFKFLISTHNRRPKDKRALNFLQIHKILSQYCQKNQFSQDFEQQLKFDLIERTQLTSQQYNLIFLGGARTHSTTQIPEYNFQKTSPISNNHKQQKNNAHLSQSAVNFSPSKNHTNQQQKHHWHSKLHLLKTNFQKDKNDYLKMSTSVQNLSDSLKKKQQESKVKNRTLTKLQKMVRDIEKQIDTKHESLKKLQDRVNKLQSSQTKGGKSKSIKQMQEKQQEQDRFVESHIIPGFALGDMMASQKDKLTPQPQYKPTASTSNFSKKKKSIYESGMSDKDIDFSYRNSLIFDKEPSCVPKKFLCNLANFLETDQFMKKKQLSLIFKRSVKYGNLGEPSAIKNRSGLLILFESSAKKHAGGFISIQIPSHTKSQNLTDYQSFIFSLTNNVKFSISKGQQKSAIAISKHYLVSFANDLMISTDCLNQQSYCQWPSLYEGGKSVNKSFTAKDLVGGNQFRIQHIEIYEVKNQQVQMIL